MKFKKIGTFRLLSIIIILLVIILIAINVLFIKAACLSRQCILINVFTILLLIWATAFWLTIVKYSNKKINGD